METVARGHKSEYFTSYLKFVTSCLDSLFFQSEEKQKLYSKLSWDFHVIFTKNLVKIGLLKRTVNLQMESCPKNVAINCCMVAGAKLPYPDRKSQL